MLKKLLKYDLQAVFRFWWIAAVISTILSLLGGFAYLMDSYEGWVPETISSIMSSTIFFAYCSYFALMVMTMGLLFLRFYKNFFSDEGYLTFTLPVHRQELWKSKVITGFIAMTASAAVCGINDLLMLGIGQLGDPENGGFFAPVITYLVRGIQADGLFFLVSLVEYFILILVFLALAVVFLYFCITFGSMIVKKGKVIVSVAIFYGATSIATAVALFLLVFGAIGSLVSWTPEVMAQTGLLMALFRLGIGCYMGALFWLLYAVQYWMLDKKLNLT